MPTKEINCKDYGFLNVFLIQYNPNNTDLGYSDDNDIRDAFIFYVPKNKVIITEEKYNYYIKEISKYE